MTATAAAANATLLDRKVALSMSPASEPGGATDQDGGYQLATSVMAFYLTGFVSVLGIIGNGLSFVVLQRASRPRRCPLFTILSALCIVDAIFILANFLINVLGVFYEYHQVASQPLYYLYLTRGYAVKYVMPVCFIMQMASIYITLLVSFERFNAVCRPLAVAREDPPSTRSVLRNLALVMLFSVVYNAPKYFELVVVACPVGSELQSPEKQRQVLERSLSLFGCYHSVNASAQPPSCEPFKYTFEAAPWLQTGNGTNWSVAGMYEIVYTGIMYTVVYFVAPVAAITVINLRIAVSLRRNIKAWRSAGRNQEKEVQLTYVSLAIVISFYLFMLPNVILTAVDVLGSSRLGGRHAVQLTIAATNFLVLINSCLNFVLYCLIGKKFRDCLRELLCGRCRRGPPVRRSVLIGRGCATGGAAGGGDGLELRPLRLAETDLA